MTTEEQQALMSVNQHKPVKAEPEQPLLDTLMAQAQQLYAISMEARETINRIGSLMGLESDSMNPEEQTKTDRNLTSVIRCLEDAITEAQSNNYALSALERKLGG